VRQKETDQMPGTCIEVALNGAWTRERQPNIPVTRDEIVAEGIACAKAGAAVIHLHAYDPKTGRQQDDYELYAPLIEGIRAEVDAIVYPTLPIVGTTFSDPVGSAHERFRHLERLAKEGLAEWAVIDPGSALFTRFEQVARGEAGMTYHNPDEHFQEGMRIAAEYKIRPSFAIYEPGCLRLGAATTAAMRANGRTPPTPVYRLMFADEFCFGFPPQERYLAAMLALLDEVVPGGRNAVPWMVAGLGVDVSTLVSPTVAQGGHIRVGLEDRPWNVDERNVTLVEDAVRIVQAAGGQVATATDTREMCAAMDQGV